MFTAFGIFTLSALLFLILRIAPYIRTGRHACDAYYFLLSREIFRKEKKLPIKIPYYLMEYEEQSYPPGFSVFLSFFPTGFIQKYHWLFNHAIELITSSIGFWLVFSLTQNPALSSLCMILYALQPGIMNELRSLTSRCLAILLFHLLFLFTFCAISLHTAFYIPAVLTGIILIYSHKLTMQVIWFVSPLMSLITKDFEWLITPILSYFAAFIIYPSYFYKIQRHHVDMIIFWSRNWKNMGRHHIYNSPLYTQKPGKPFFYEKENLKTWALYFKRFLLEAPYFPFIAALPFAVTLDDTLFYLETYVSTILIAALCVIYIPFLRGIGAGWQYAKYAALPTSILLALTLAQPAPLWLIAVISLCAILQLYFYIKTVKSFTKKNEDSENKKNFESLLNAIKELPEEARLVCLPLELCDATVFFTRRFVLWGSHSYPFSRIEGFFPVIKSPLENFIHQYEVQYAVLDTGYVDPDHINIKGNILSEHGCYKLYKLAEEKDSGQ